MTDTDTNFRATVREVNLPNAVGWEWIGEDWTDDLGVHHDGLEHSLVWTRPGGAPMIYSIKNADGQWTHITTRHPRMENIHDLKTARQVACWFIHNEEGDRP